MKTIKLVTLLLFVVAYVHVEAAASRQTRQFSGFHGISVSSGIDLYLSQKSAEEVVVEAESDELDKIVTTVEGGILKIFLKEKSWFNINVGNNPHKVYVSFKTLDMLDASAGSDVVSQSLLKFEKLDLGASSGSDIKLELEALVMKVESSSGSDVLLKGSAAVMHASASSGSDINAGELQTRKCAANVSSGSDIRINVSEELDATASSGGDITYYGNPARKNINESSGGDVQGR